MSRLQLILAILLLGNETRAQDSFERFRYSASAMGTTFVLTFYASSQSQANQSADLAFQRIEELNQIFSDYLENSEISQLAQKSGQKVQVSDDLWYLIRLSKQISRHSSGAFDVTIGPLSRLWRRAIRQQQFPDSTRIIEAQKLVNYKWIKLYPSKQQVKLKKAGMRLDFGGIAKGYAIDQAYKVLQQQGMSIALIDGGGDLFISADPPEGTKWDIKDHSGGNIEIHPPVAIASSGDQYRYLRWEGRNYSHIIDPLKGQGLVDSEIVTVTAADATTADALASAVSVLSRSAGDKLLKKYRARRLKR